MPSEPRSRRSILGLPWSVALLAAGAIFTGSAQAEQTIAEDLTVQGILKLDDPAAAPMLYFQGTPASGVSTGAVGASISYLDGTIGTIIYKINRLGVAWNWQAATSGTDRLQMKLDDGNILSLIDPANAANSIAIDPGTAQHGQAGVYVNGVRLAKITEVVPSIQGVAGYGNLGVGGSALAALTSGGYNVGVGPGALMNMTEQNNNTAVGTNALHMNVASDLTAVGSGALRDNTTGAYNLAVGSLALSENTTGIFNLAIGQGALQHATGSFNLAVGPFNLGWATGQGNSGVGVGALQALTSGDHNASFGFQSLFGNSTGSRNTAIGSQAGGGYELAVVGLGNQTGSDNVFIGYSARGATNDLNNATAIGSGAVVAASNSLVLGNGQNVGIGTSAPDSKLEVVGNVKVGGNMRISGRVRIEPQGDIGMGDFQADPAP